MGEKRAMKNNGTKGRKGQKKGRSKTQSLEDDDEDFMPIKKTANKKRPPRKMKIKQITKKSLVFDKAKYIGSESDEEIPSLTAQKIKTKNISKRDTVSDKVEYLASESDEEISSLTAQKIKTKNISRKCIVSGKAEYLASLTLSSLTKNISRKSILSDKAEYLSSDSDEEIPSLAARIQQRMS